MAMGRSLENQGIGFREPMLADATLAIRQVAARHSSSNSMVFQASAIRDLAIKTAI
jgi:hypothetical protein